MLGATAGRICVCLKTTRGRLRLGELLSAICGHGWMAPQCRVSGHFLEPRSFSARLPHRRKVLFQSSLVSGCPVLHGSLRSHLPNFTLQPLFMSGVYRPQRSPGSYPHKPDQSHRESLIETQHRAPPSPCAVVHLWAHQGHLERQLGFVSSRHQPPSDDNQQQS